jgi:hypothetical protein
MTSKARRCEWREVFITDRYGAPVNLSMLSVSEVLANRGLTVIEDAETGRRFVDVIKPFTCWDVGYEALYYGFEIVHWNVIELLGPGWDLPHHAILAPIWDAELPSVLA